eukprot:115776_1
MINYTRLSNQGKQHSWRHPNPTREHYSRLMGLLIALCIVLGTEALVSGCANGDYDSISTISHGSLKGRKTKILPAQVQVAASRSGLPTELPELAIIKDHGKSLSKCLG